MTTRMRLEIPLRTISPLHVGAVQTGAKQWQSDEIRRTRPRTDPGMDSRLLAQDADGHLILRGSSLAGALRAAIGHESGRQDVGRAWGSASRASCISVEDVDLGPKANTPTVHRHGNTVDRHLGTAADGALFTHEVLPPGTRFTLVLNGHTTDEPATAARNNHSPEAAPSTEEVRDELTAVLAAIDRGRLVLGARRNAGWGRVKLAVDAMHPVLFMSADLSTLEGLRMWVAAVSGDADNHKQAAAAAGQDLLDQSRQATPSEGRRTLTVSITWNSQDGILVHDPERLPDAVSEEAEHRLHMAAPGTPLPSRPVLPLRQGDHYILPGAGVRGALRSRMGRIVRTAQGQGDPQPAAPIDDVHEFLTQEPTVITALFGSTRWAGALRVDDCRAQNGREDVRQHVAIDRWTGGAVIGRRGLNEQDETGGRLFVEHVVVDADWEPLTLTVDLERLEGNIRESAQHDLTDEEVRRMRDATLCALGLALAEAAAGFLTLGGRAARGCGHVTVPSLTVRSNDPDVEDLEVQSTPISQAEAAGKVLAWARRLWTPHERESLSSWADCLDPLRPDEGVRA
ncbi:hypothetical protein J5X07_04455 [Actinomyces bowdenii]|uniref:RAMP superfamily CRISPR-associated protein n=1 Tax=Actinomyces bowdenii TaxID=131109 RepID=UPI001ABCC7CA|nr:RAMP superfamily CRISPR-associated protein [Actinomyces bowdenii]MBO3724282.1 hypothetical protein [Actinomyces bowdenii]